jgi:hypothetical protein
MRTSLFIGALLGNLARVRLPGLFERKDEYIWTPFLNPEETEI